MVDQWMVGVADVIGWWGFVRVLVKSAAREWGRGGVCWGLTTIGRWLGKPRAYPGSLEKRKEKRKKRSSGEKKGKIGGKNPLIFGTYGGQWLNLLHTCLICVWFVGTHLRDLVSLFLHETENGLVHLFCYYAKCKSLAVSFIWLVCHLAQFGEQLEELLKIKPPKWLDMQRGDDLISLMLN